MPDNKLVATARSHSEDPMQEHLRQRKADWNTECSEFIAQINEFKPHLIALKRGLNGRGDAKAGLPISSIKDPLPPKIQGYMSGVSGEFHQLSAIFERLLSDAQGILAEQSTYSNRRRKSQKHRLASQECADSALTVEGSSSFSRWWSNVSTLFSRNEITNQRLSLLKQAHSVYLKLVEFEDIILEKGVDNIPTVLTDFLSIQNEFRAIEQSFKNYLVLKKIDLTKLLPPPAKDDSEEKPVATQNAENVITDNDSESRSKSDKVQKEKKSDKTKSTPVVAPIVKTPPPTNQQIKYPAYDVNKVSLENLKQNIAWISNFAKNNNLDNPDTEVFNKHFRDWFEEQDTSKRVELEKIVRDAFQHSLRRLYELVSDKFDIEIPQNYPFRLLGNLIEQAKNDPSLTRQAKSSYLGKLYKQYSHKLITDTTTAARLQIFHQIRDLKKETDSLMDLLELSDPNPSDILKCLDGVNTLLDQTEKQVKILDKLFINKYFTNNKNKKEVNIDPVNRFLTRHLRRSIDKPGW